VDTPEDLERVSHWMETSIERVSDLPAARVK